MQFTPKSEQDLKKEADERLTQYLWEPGEYDYTVVEGFDTQSKKGNDMIQLNVTVYNEDGRTLNIYDYLLESMAFKLRHSAYASGLGEKYEDADLHGEDYIGKSGRLLLAVQPPQNGYGAKNIIKDYVVPAEGIVVATKAKTAKAQAETPELDDEIPF